MIGNYQNGKYQYNFDYNSLIRKTNMEIHESQKKTITTHSMRNLCHFHIKRTDFYINID